MPPKSKFSREQVTCAALAILRRSGRDALTARALGRELDSSARPIFTLFSGMDEVFKEALDAAKGIYAEYVGRGLAMLPAFKGVGLQYIEFARREPNLFRLLFVSPIDGAPPLSEVLGIIEGSYDEILTSITESYHLPEPAALRIYRHLWIYTHGIAVLILSGTCRFTDDEISRMLTEVFVALLKDAKAELAGASEKGGATAPTDDAASTPTKRDRQAN